MWLEQRAQASPLRMYTQTSCGSAHVSPRPLAERPYGSDGTRQGAILKMLPPSLALALALALALVLVLALSAIGMPAAKEKVVIAELSWDGALAIAHVLKTIIETELNGEVDLILADQPVIFAAMDKGDGRIDVHPDFWMPNQAGFWNRFIAKGSRGTVVVNTPYHALQGLYIPRYVQRQYGVHSVKDLSDPLIANLFDSDGNDKGEYWAGAPGWASTNIEKVKAKSYGYARYFEPLEVSVATFQAKLKTDYRRKRPILFYYWRPEWIHAAYDLVRLEEPAFDGFAMESKKDDVRYNPHGCWKMYQPKDDLDWYEKSRITCAWPDARVYIASSASLTDRAPKAAQFFSQVTLTADMVGDWIFKIVVEKKEPSNVAKRWVKEHSCVVHDWLKGI